MIQHADKTKCETNMSGGTAFTIQANAKMFKILSSGLYSNKEKAIIREVSCNAYDANVDAGNGDVPIIVHLPNALEPFFSIKDSGTGLNPDQMVSIYTQYGNSTKTERNDQIGALGLGSKSPFSYIDSFTVISITEGMKNTYSCYIDGNGEPQLQPFGSEESDECNGVEVTFPVKQEDFSKFREQAELVFRPFEVKPTITGNSEYEVKDFKILLASEDNEDTADWQLVESYSENRYNTSKIKVAVQGNIEYPLNVSQFYDELSKNAKELSGENYRLHFDIGDLDIAASREELGYDKVTIANIVAKFEKMASEIVAVQNEKINEFETLYEAMQYITKIKSGTNIYANFDFEYKGEPIDNSVQVPREHIIVKYFKNNRRNSITRKQMGDDYKETFHFAVPKDNATFVYNDDGKKTKAVTKARSLVTSMYDVVYLISDLETLEVLGNPPYINASEIEVEKVQRGKAGPGKFFKVFNNSTYESSQWYDNFSSADNVGLDVSEDFYYVNLVGRKSAREDIYLLKKVAEKLGLIKEAKIFGVSASHANTKKFGEYGGTEFIEFIKGKLSRSRKFKTQLKKIADYQTHQNISRMSGKFFELVRDKDFLEVLDDDSLFKEVGEDYGDLDIENQSFLNEIQSVAYQVDAKAPKSDYVKHEKLENAYPLISDTNWRTEHKDIADYVRGMDLLKKLKADDKSANDSEENKETTEEEVA